MTIYNKTIWVNGSAPAISAANLGNAENGIDTAHTELQTHIDNATGAHAASAISNVSAGNIVSTTVQAAVNELDTEKVAKAGDTMTSTLIVQPGTDVPSLKIIPGSDTATTKFMIQGRNHADGADKFTVDNAGNIVAPQLTGALIGNASTSTLASTVTVVDSTSATTWPCIFDSETGSLAAKTDGGLTYNASTAALSTTTFVGALTGNASTVTGLTLASGSITLSGGFAITLTTTNTTSLTLPTGGQLIPTNPTGGNKKVTNIYYNVSTGELDYEVEP